MSSLTSAARQIADARANPSIPTSQASSFDVLRQSQRVSPAELAERAAPPLTPHFPAESCRFAARLALSLARAEPAFSRAR